ncbi:MAG: riboflavin biosynthesis protein RibF [Candidatus Omnitrophica bacterium]|nr:riboflavin biosynthesis protein RibF [Candidatus Omnitrophota bacterium]
MQTIYFHNKVRKPVSKDVVIGIGKFDGLHIGHQKVIRTIMDTAKDKKIIPAVFTFKDFPCNFYLYPWEERINFFKNAGIKLCIWSDFEKIKLWEPDKFLERLKKFYKVSHIVVGKNFKFGLYRKGDEKFLLSWGEKNNVSISIVSPVIMNTQPVSSSRIRSLVKQGSVHTVYEMTGRYFSVTGRVVKGINLAKKLGTPTANLEFTNDVHIYPGVYVAVIKYGNRLLRGIAYYGSSPTVSLNQERFEVHLFDFLKNVYGKKLKVYLIKKIRQEKTFPSQESLKEQIEKDIHTAKTCDINGTIR